jgi:thiosulfate/3-mercaptopyruvate sulfurtransferase
MNKRLTVMFTTVFLAVAAPHAGAQSRKDLLVDASWLQKHLSDANLVLLHVGDRAEYDREHIQGARFVTMSDLAAPRQHSESMDHAKELMLELPTPEAARAKLKSLGISDKSRIIVYYGKDWVSPSTRVVFTLDWIGLGARTSLLDGGMQAWKRNGGAVTADLPTVKPGKLSAKPVKSLVVDHAFVRANLKTPNIAIIDARVGSFYDGTNDGARPGHIPGAGSFPFTQVTDDSLRYKSPQELTQLFQQAGYKRGETIVVYCHIGQQATAVVFAARTLGYNVLLYDGSYTQWEALADTPVEKTAAAGTP